MKSVIHTILLFLLCALFCQCNGDIFVKEFIPSIDQCTLNGNGDSISIRFTSGDWNVSTLYFTYGIEYNEGEWKFYSDEENSGLSAPTIAWSGKGKGIYENPFTKIVVTRELYDQLKINVDENSYAEPYQLCIETTNSVDYKEIYITVLPGTPYQIERIEYNLDAFYISQSQELKDEACINNESSSPINWHIDVFKNAYCLLRFEQDKNNYPYNPVTPETKFPIPYFDPLSNKLKMGNEEAAYSSNTQVIPAKLSNIAYDLTVPANSTMKVQVYWIWNESITPYKIYFVHPQTDRRYQIEGVFYRYTPIDYYITTTNVE